MRRGVGCPNCNREVQAVDGLCPLCGTSLPRTQESMEPEILGPVDSDLDAVVPPEIMPSEDTDPGAAPTHEEDSYEDEDEYEDEYEDEDEDEGDPPAESEDAESLSEDATRLRSDESDEAPKDVEDPPTEAKAKAEDKPLPKLPWGKAVIVLAYLLIGGTCMLHEHVSSEGAIVDRHLRAADDILGSQMGAATDSNDLIKAADHYLEVLAVDKHNTLAHRRLDLIKRRLEERRGALPEEMARRHSAISSRAQLEKAQASKSFWSELPITPSERFGLDAQERRMRRNSYVFFGGLGLLITWMVVAGSIRRLNTRELRGPNEVDPKDSFLP